MRTLVKMQFGSHVYGTDVPGSDLDYKAIHVPRAQEILLGRTRESINVTRKKEFGEKNVSGDIDFESFSLGKYMKLLCEGQTIALDMLFTPDKWVMESSDEWWKIQRRRGEWIHKGVSAFVGYCRQQANKYGIKGSRIAAARAAVEFFEGLQASGVSLQTKLSDVWEYVEEFADAGLEHVGIVVEKEFDDRPPQTMLEVCNRKVQKTASLKMALGIYRKILDEYGERARWAEKNEGVDWKALMHAVRVCSEAEELLASGVITFPRPERELLLQIRKGELAYKQVAEIIETGMVCLEACKEKSTLRDSPDVDSAEKLVVDVYAREVCDEHC